MQLYQYPVGCKFGGDATTTTQVRRAMTFTDPNNIIRPVGIFRKPELLAEIGIKTWKEERPAPGYQIVSESAPIDTETETSVVRTWQTEPIPGYAAAMFDKAYAAKLKEITDGSTAAVDAITASYSVPEIQTWQNQEKEALAFKADNTSPTPLLSILAAKRDCTVDALATKVLENVDAYVAAAGSIIGEQQAFEQRLKSCSSIEEIADITVEY